MGRTTVFQKVSERSVGQAGQRVGRW